MLKGLIKIYSFTIKTDINVEDIIRRCKDVFYKNPDIELFYVEKKMGKIIISFIQERTGFESLMDPNDKNEIVYTVQSKKED